MKLNPNVLEVGTCRKDLWSPLGQAKGTGRPALVPAMGLMRPVTTAWPRNIPSRGRVRMAGREQMRGVKLGISRGPVMKRGGDGFIHLMKGVTLEE